VTHRRRPDNDHDARLRAERLRFARYRASGDPREREQLIERYMPLARSLARRYAGSQESFDDLMQVACIGLVKAVDRFDPDRRIAFSSYAVPTIAGELRRYYRDHSWAVRMPRELQELSLRIEQTWAELAAAGGRAPTVRELAVRLATDDETVLAALEAATAQHAEALTSDPELTGDHHRRRHTNARVDPGYDLAEKRQLLASLLATLEPRDRWILYLRFHGGLTQTEIGRRVGVSQMSVSRILRSSLERLRAAAGAESSVR
jgi:RNA polymerase sigma-B factor